MSSELRVYLDLQFALVAVELIHQNIMMRENRQLCFYLTAFICCFSFERAQKRIGIWGERSIVKGELVGSFGAIPPPLSTLKNALPILDLRLLSISLLLFSSLKCCDLPGTTG